MDNKDFEVFELDEIETQDAGKGSAASACGTEESNVWGESVRTAKKKDHAFSAGVFTGLFLGIGFMVVIGVMGIFFVGREYLFGPADPTGSGNSSEQTAIDDSNTISKLEYLEALIDRYYLWGVDKQTMIDGMYKGLFEALGDPYSVYYTKEEYDSMMESASGLYCGIGVQVSQNAETKVITVTTVFDGSPAEEAGVIMEDVITEVAGTDVSDMDLEDVVTLIKGEEGTSVEITVYRDGEFVTMDVMRREIEVPTVDCRVLDGDIGYIIISSFDEVTDAQFKKAVDFLREQNISKVIIDLRYNGGGYLDTVVEMLDYILPEGMLVYTKDKDGGGEEYMSTDKEFWDGVQMAVLTNGYTASASEIFAGAVRDYGVAKLVGTNTFGKGIVQSVLPLSDGTAVKVTVSEYYTPSGFALHKVGLAPDVEAELSEDAVLYDPEKDNQLKEAIRVLEEE